MESRTTIEHTGHLCSVTMTIVPTLDAQGPPPGEDGDSTLPAPAKIEIIEGDIVMDTVTLLNRLVRVHPPIGIA